MQRGQSHNSLDLGAHQGAAEHGYRALAVDHRGYAQFFVNVSGRAKPADFFGRLGTCCRAGEESSRTKQSASQCAETTQKWAALQFFVEDHELRSLLCNIYYGCGAIDFHERIAWKRRDGDGRARGPAARKVSLKNLVHAVVVVDAPEIDGELQD